MRADPKAVAVVLRAVGERATFVAGWAGYRTGDFRPTEASTSLVGRGLVRTPATAPLTRHCPSARRSLDLANVRAQRRSVEPPYSTRSPGASGARALSVQILFLTS